MSQYWHRSGQPVSRTKVVGRPVDDDSPWREWNISVMRSETGEGSFMSSVEPYGARVRAGAALLAQFGSVTLREACRSRVRILVYDTVEVLQRA